jgi:DNA-binding protein H-NS
MRKPRDYDSELQALSDKAKQLKDRKLHQLGELVIATGADAPPVEQLAGLLLSATYTSDTATKEGWRKRGAAFFQRAGRTGCGARQNTRGAQTSERGEAPASGTDRAQ